MFRRVVLTTSEMVVVMCAGRLLADQLLLLKPRFQFVSHELRRRLGSSLVSALSIFPG